MTSKNEPQVFLALDAMRGVGAMLVVIGHSDAFWNGYVLPNGVPLVDMFFMLSGFVIAFAYEQKFHAGMSVRKFMLQRFVRLYPLYFLGFVMGAVVRLVMIADRDAEEFGDYFIQLLAQLFVVPSPNLSELPTFYLFNGPAWTLLFELVANLLYVVCWRWLKSTRILAVVVGLSAVWLVAAALTGGQLDMGPTWNDFWGGFARGTFSFFGGVLLFRLVGSPKAVKGRVTVLAALPALLLPIVVMPNVPQAQPGVALATAIILGPVLIWWAQRMIPPRWLWKTFAALGSMSYAMYILHYPIFLVVQRASWKIPELATVWAPWTGVAILVFVFAFSVAAERFYDVPVRAWINGKLKARAMRRKAQLATHAVAAE